MVKISENLHKTRNAWQSLACSPPGIAVLLPSKCRQQSLRSSNPFQDATVPTKRGVVNLAPKLVAMATPLER